MITVSMYVRSYARVKVIDTSIVLSIIVLSLLIQPLLRMIITLTSSMIDMAMITIASIIAKMRPRWATIGQDDLQRAEDDPRCAQDGPKIV